MMSSRPFHGVLCKSLPAGDLCLIGIARELSRKCRFLDLERMVGLGRSVNGSRVLLLFKICAGLSNEKVRLSRLFSQDQMSSQ